MPRRAGGIRRKRRTHKVVENESVKKAPKSFIIHSGEATLAVKELVADWRQIMSPYSALKLREHRQNRIKDFISASSVFGVTHLMIFSQSISSIHWKIARLPSGPTLTFRVNQFSLSSDVRNHQKKSHLSQSDFVQSPVVVLNGFKELSSKSSTEVSGTEPPIKLVATFIGHMFPSIDIQSVSAKDCRRVVLFNRNKETEEIDVRHYSVMKRPAGVPIGMRKLIEAKKNPHKIFSLPSGEVSASEEERTEVAVPTDGKNSGAPTQLAIRMHEIGPRMAVELVKVEEDVLTGKVLYHKFIKKTAKELEKLEENAPKIIEKRKRELEKEEKMVKRRRKLFEPAEAQKQASNKKIRDEQ